MSAELSHAASLVLPALVCGDAQDDAGDLTDRAAASVCDELLGALLAAVATDL